MGNSNNVSLVHHNQHLYCDAVSPSRPQDSLVSRVLVIALAIFIATAATVSSLPIQGAILLTATAACYFLFNFFQARRIQDVFEKLRSNPAELYTWLDTEDFSNGDIDILLSLLSPQEVAENAATKLFFIDRRNFQQHPYYVFTKMSADQLLAWIDNGTEKCAFILTQVLEISRIIHDFHDDSKELYEMLAIKFSEWCGKIPCTVPQYLNTFFIMKSAFPFHIESFMAFAEHYFASVLLTEAESRKSSGGHLETSCSVCQLFKNKDGTPLSLFVEVLKYPTLYDKLPNDLGDMLKRYIDTHPNWTKLEI